MLPKTIFDFKLATDMLNGGKSEIKGVTFYEERAGLINLEHLCFPAYGQFSRTFVKSVNLSGMTNSVELQYTNSALSSLDLTGLNKLEVMDANCFS
jgi:hypothetical protein